MSEITADFIEERNKKFLERLPKRGEKPLVPAMGMKAAFFIACQSFKC